MLQLLQEGLEEGALGIGLAVQYYPGATRREIVEVFRFAGEKRATIHTHVRSMTIDAMQEVLANAVATGAPLHIVHVNSMALGEIDTVLDLIGGARRLGLDVTTEAYPIRPARPVSTARSSMKGGRTAWASATATSSGKQRGRG